jgi:putative transposase
MARLPRAVFPGQVHLLVQRGHSGQAVFVDPTDRDHYLAALRDAAAEAKVAVHAYGLLDNEVRLLATPTSIDGLAAMLQGTGRRYVRLFNRLHHRSGSPWEGRFRSAIVEADAYFVACLRYVEVVGTDHEGPPPLAESSARHHLGLASSPLVREHPGYWALGNTPFEREAAYRRLFDRPLPDNEVATILRALKSGWTLGSASFALAAQDQTGRRAVPLSPGRPRQGPT